MRNSNLATGSDISFGEDRKNLSRRRHPIEVYTLGKEIVPPLTMGGKSIKGLIDHISRENPLIFVGGNSYKTSNFDQTVTINRQEKEYRVEVERQKMLDNHVPSEWYSSSNDEELRRASNAVTNITGGMPSHRPTPNAVTELAQRMYSYVNWDDTNAPGGNVPNGLSYGIECSIIK